MDAINEATDQLINSLPNMILSNLFNAAKQLAPVFAPAFLLVIIGTLAFSKRKMPPILRVILICLSLLILAWMFYPYLTQQK